MSQVANDSQFAINYSEKNIYINGHKEKLPEGSILRIVSIDDNGEFTFNIVLLRSVTLLSVKLYKCTSSESIDFFSHNIFNFVSAIRNPYDRIRFIQSTDHKNFILNLKLNDVIKIPRGAARKCTSNSFQTGFVLYIGEVDEIGIGTHFIVSIWRLDWLPIPKCLDRVVAKYIDTELEFLRVILSAEYIYHSSAPICPTNVNVFHAYKQNFMLNMSRNYEHSDKITKTQAFEKRNASSIVLCNDNISKPPQKPFYLDGKDIYVIDTSDTDNAVVEIIQKNQYEDRSAFLNKTPWPEGALGFEFINNESGNVTTSSKGSRRPTSSNVLDHFNHKSASKDVSSSTTTSKYHSNRKPIDLHNNYNNDVNHTNEIQERPDMFTKIPDSTLGIDAMVTVITGSCEPLNGVIRAIFKIGSIVMVGVELEDFVPYVPLNLTDGTFSGHKFFECQNGKALFIEAECCHKDDRFADDFVAENKLFGHPESPVVMENIPPISLRSLIELEQITGESKGIQGHNNSCYLDASLFSMFTFAQCFDSLLYRPPDKKDIKHYDKVRGILRDEIVHPLRKHQFVRADRVLKLRELLEEISTMTGLTNEEKDPEEFMNILMAQTLRAEPYLKFNSGQDAFYYQLFVEKNDELTLPNVQQLFEQSFKTSNIKLREVPPCLIIQMPRFGKSYKMYPRIVPSQVLDITDVVEGQPPACVICGILAVLKCVDCEKEFCQECCKHQHLHINQHHKRFQSVEKQTDFPELLNQQTVPRIHMDLFAVVCIETSHYVSFVKAGELPDAPWLFFDSMSDRRGGQNGYNIPSMVSVPDLPQWLSEEGARNLHEATPKDKLLPPFAKRLLCDAYMCMYVSRDVSMYK